MEQVGAPAAAVEGAAPRARPLAGWTGRLASTLAALLAAWALYWVLFAVQPVIYRTSFLLIGLLLVFLLYPARRGAGGRVGPADWMLVAAAIGAFGWPLLDFAAFVYRAAEPTRFDLVCGAAAIVLVLEAVRRSVGWVLPATAAAFLVYAWMGPVLDRLGLSLIAHRGYGVTRLVGSLFMTLEGVFGVPLDVAATYIILFAIYGAALHASGAGQFFIDWALSMGGRSAAAPARSVTFAGFLLGTVSGSGVSTTVMLGSVAWPVLRRAGYGPETAGGILSAAGIGALLSPPTLGAAAFLIAEFLQISYLQVLLMALVPTALYYLSLLVMVEADARRARPDGGSDNVGTGVRRPAGAIFRAGWHHLASLVAVAAFMAAGMTAFRAVFWATVLAIAASYLRPAHACGPSRWPAILETAGRDVLPIVATTAAAGIIVGVVTLTGLGLKIAGLIVALAGGTQVLTVLYSAAAVWLLGTAVPVTASYIIAAVMVAPALVTAGITEPAAHMFIFYYAVLSEVSPPTALAPFAAAALTGGRPFRTMFMTWRYTMPAFLVPFAFTLAPDGAALLLRGSPGAVVWATLTAAAGIVAAAAALGGWAPGRLRVAERLALGGAGLLLLHGSAPAAGAGITAGLVVLLLQSRRHPRAARIGPRR